MEPTSVVGTITSLTCKRCNAKTEHLRIKHSVMMVVWPLYNVQRLDYPSPKYKCLRCGQTRKYNEELAMVGREDEEEEK